MPRARDALDDALARVGEDMTLRRTVGTVNQANVDVKVRGTIRGYAPEQLVGEITQQDALVIISPTPLMRAQWPGGQRKGQAVDPMIPRRGDKMRAQGRWRTVEAVGTFEVDNEIVRFEIRVRG